MILIRKFATLAVMFFTTASFANVFGSCVANAPIANQTFNDADTMFSAWVTARENQTNPTYGPGCTFHAQEYTYPTTLAGGVQGVAVDAQGFWDGCQNDHTLGYCLLHGSGNCHVNGGTEGYNGPPNINVGQCTSITTTTTPGISANPTAPNLGFYTPQLGFTDSQGTVHQDGITYDSANTAGQWACDAYTCTVTIDLKLTNAGTDPNTYATVISLPQKAGATVPAQGGNGNATMFYDSLSGAVNATINVAAGSSWAYIYLPTAGGQALMPKSDVTNTLWLTSTFVYSLQ